MNGSRRRFSRELKAKVVLEALQGEKTLQEIIADHRAAPEQRIFPYLPRGLWIERPDQVWCADITDIPAQRGFLHLVAIMDWASRYVLAWRPSNTLDARFGTDALEEALAAHGASEIFSTEQSSQFASFAFAGRLQAAGIRISMVGRGRFMDNVRPLTRTDGVRGVSHQAAVALAEIRSDLLPRDRGRPVGPVRDPGLGRPLQRREVACGIGRMNTGRGILRRSA